VEVNRGIFEDFVRPAFEDFELAHVDYIESLTRYSARLKNASLVMNHSHPIVGDIVFDSLKSAHLRTKLAHLKTAEAESKLRPFLSVINWYLNGLSASRIRIDFISKPARYNPRHFKMSEFRKGLGDKHGGERLQDHALWVSGLSTASADTKSSRDVC
jgi:hypothetical protein